MAAHTTMYPYLDLTLGPSLPTLGFGNGGTLQV